MDTPERLQKVIARSGLCSRRKAEDLIREGRVLVNGQAATLGQKVTSEDAVKVDGKRIRAAEPRRYILLYKPRGVMTTCEDPEERRTVIDLVRPVVRERVFPVGRLDYHSEGLILLTNDGDLAARVSHPRHGVVREYRVKVKGDLDDEARARLLRGTVVDGVPVRPLTAERESGARGGTNTWWRVTVQEGRTREVRELFFRAGHRVQRLQRTAIGPLRDPSLKAGELRFLTDDEVRELRGQPGAEDRSNRGRRARPPRRTASAARGRPPRRRGR
jgi:23S rRNA pseudouridine2605 synthase